MCSIHGGALGVAAIAVIFDSAVKTPRWDTVSFAHETIFKAMTDT